MTLRDVSVGQTVKVTRLNGDGPVKIWELLKELKSM